MAPKTSWLNNIVRKEILELKAYSSARGEFSGTANIQLDANECPYPPYGDLNSTLNRYPEPQPIKLLNKLAEIYKINPEQLLITRGMDEGLDLLIKTFCSPFKEQIAILPPTFGFYEVSANINSVETIKIPLLEDFEANWPALKELPNTCKVIFFCSPNNPSGNTQQLAEIEKLCAFYKDKKIIAVDEAYGEFSQTPSALTLLNKYENLICLRTLSKAYALAGLRLGTLMANPKIINLLKKLLAPYPIPSPSAEIALKSLSSIGLLYSQEKINSIIEERKYLTEKFETSNLFEKIYKSEANFILVKAKNSAEIYNNLKRFGIIIRDRKTDIPGTLRISVGTKEENEILLKALGILENKEIEKIRQYTIKRQTKETEILCSVVLDDKGRANINTGLNFFNHMLEQIAKHSGISLTIQAKGDLEIDCHHTIEDVAIVLGQTLKQALGDKRGIRRYSFLLPMDEAQAQVSLDLSGRAYCLFEYPFENQIIGDISSEMIKHFFESLSHNLEMTLHLKVTGENNHHMVEALFKAFAKTLNKAISIVNNQLPSTKGSL